MMPMHRLCSTVTRRLLVFEPGCAALVSFSYLRLMRPLDAKCGTAVGARYSLSYPFSSSAPSASSKNLVTSAEIAALVSRSLRFLDTLRPPLLIGALRPRTLRTRAVQRWIHHSWQGMAASALGPSLVGRIGALEDSVGPEDGSE